MDRPILFFSTKSTTPARTTQIISTTKAPLPIKNHEAIVTIGNAESALIAVVVLAVLFLVISMVAFYLWTRRRYGRHYGQEC